MDELIETMAEAMCEHDNYPAMARAALNALRAAGYEVVKLPGQMTERENVAESIRNLPMWEVDDSWVCRIDQDDIEIEADGQSLYGTMRVDKAASLAAALLAAHAAEVVSDE